MNDLVTYKIEFQNLTKDQKNDLDIEGHIESFNKTACFSRLIDYMKVDLPVKSVFYEKPLLENYDKYFKRIQTIFPYLKEDGNFIEVPCINLKQCFVILTILRTPLTLINVNAVFIQKFCKKQPSMKYFLQLHNDISYYNFANANHLLLPHKVKLDKYTNKKFNNWLYNYNKEDSLCHSIIKILE